MRSIGWKVPPEVAFSSHPEGVAMALAAFIKE